MCLSQYKSATANLGQAKRFFPETHKEKVSFQTMVVGNLMLVLNVGNKH